jgi:hypothetical protein
MNNKIMLLLTQNPDERPGILEPYLASEGQHIRGKLPKGARHLRSFHLADDPTQQIAHASEMQKSPPAFDAIFEVAAADATWDQLIRAVDGIGDRLGGLINLSKSAVIAGTEHVIIPGEQALMIIFALRRLDALSSMEFHDYWLHKHSQVALEVPNLKGYKQFHADPAATARAAEALGVGIKDFEGTAEGSFESLDDFLKIMSSPEVAQRALEDEKKFIDHSRSSIGLYHVAWRAFI